MHVDLRQIWHRKTWHRLQSVGLFFFGEPHDSSITSFFWSQRRFGTGPISGATARDGDLQFSGGVFKESRRSTRSSSFGLGRGLLQTT